MPWKMPPKPKQYKYPHPLGVYSHAGREFAATVEPLPAPEMGELEATKQKKFGDACAGGRTEAWKFVLYGEDGDRFEQAVAGFHADGSPIKTEDPPWGKAWDFAWKVLKMQLDGEIGGIEGMDEEGEEWKKGKKPDDD